MAPTLLPGDRVLLRRRRPGSALSLGSVVGFVDPRPCGEVLMLKRITAIDGERVTVLGDNRWASTDSRTFGPVERRMIPWVLVRRYARAGVTG